MLSSTAFVREQSIVADSLPLPPPVSRTMTAEEAISRRALAPVRRLR